MILRRSFLYGIIAAGALAHEADAAVLRVPSEYPTISSAAAVAVAGDSILVAPGEYDEAQPGVGLLGGVALVSEGGREFTHILGPGLGTGFDPPYLGCFVRGFTFLAGPDGDGPAVYNAGEGSEITECRFEGTRFLGESFDALRGLNVHDSELINYKIHLGIGQSGRMFSLVRNLIDSRNSEETLVLYGSNEFVIRSNTVIAPRMFGGGVLEPDAHVEVVNNIFYTPENHSQWFGCSPSEVFDIRYNCFHDVLPEQCPVGPTNIFADPLFCDLDGEDYRLQPDSPCVGSGEGGATMGAFPVGCSAAGVPESLPGSPPRLLQAFSNPLLLTQPFVLQVESDAWARIRLLDSMGRVVANLLDGPVAAGTRTFQWNGRSQTGGHVASGVYYLTVEALGIRETHRVLLVR